MGGFTCEGVQEIGGLSEGVGPGVGRKKQKERWPGLPAGRARNRRAKRRIGPGVGRRKRKGRQAGFTSGGTSRTKAGLSRKLGRGRREAEGEVAGLGLGRRAAGAAGVKGRGPGPLTLRRISLYAKLILCILEQDEEKGGGVYVPSVSRV